MTHGSTSQAKHQMTTPRLYATLAVMLTVLSTSAGAAPIHYSEAVSGDLPENAPFPILQLGTGVNTVTGTSFVNFPVGGPNSADFDSFEFTIPADTALTAISYSSTVTLNTSNDSYLRLEAFLDTVSPLASDACQEFYIINTPSIGPTCLVPPGNTFNSPLPLGANTYLLYEGQFQVTSYGKTDWDYTWSLTVQPLPEPGSFATLALGIALLGIGIAIKHHAAADSRR